MTIRAYVLFFATLLFAPPLISQTAPAPTPTTPPTSLRVLLNSDDKIEHAGFYWAVQKELFKQNNLNVTLLTPSTQDALNKLEYGEVDIAMESLPMALQKNQTSRNMCLIKQITNAPGIALVSQNPQLKNINQFEGQTLFYETPAAYLASRIWLSTEGLSVEGQKAKIKFRKYDRILADFTTGKISHAIVNSSWLPLLYNQISGTLQVFTPSFVKGATLGSGLYVTQKKYDLPTFKANLDLFLANLDAGFSAVFSSKQEAIDLLLPEKDKRAPDEVLMKRLSIIEECYVSQTSFAKDYEHSLQTIMSVEAVSEIKEYPQKSFLAVSGK